MVKEKRSKKALYFDLKVKNLEKNYINFIK